MNIKTTNTILYCSKWKETVDFYKMQLGFQVITSRAWFIEFKLTETSRLSIADEARTSIESNDGKGLTITLEVNDIETAHMHLTEAGLNPTEIKYHPWGAKVIHLFDPEGNRIEFWSPIIAVDQ